MKIRCPHCKARHEFKNISFRDEEGTAVCNNCGKDFSAKRATMAGLSQILEQEHFEGKNISETPKGIFVIKYTDRLVLEISNYEIKTGKFRVIPGGILVLVTSIFIPFVLGDLPTGDIMFLFVFSVFVLTGWFLTTTGLAAWINKTHIVVSEKNLIVKHRPIPFKGKKIPTQDIAQVFIKQHRHSDGEGGHSTSCSVNAVLKNGQDKKIVSGWRSPLHAVFVETKIEEFLKIKDGKVEGEYDAPIYPNFSTSGILGIFKNTYSSIKNQYKDK